jgi:hypothetical protein
MSKADLSKVELTYEEWIKEIDAFIFKRAGLTTHDLADWLSRDLYDAGESVREGARECLFAQDLDDEMIENILY